MRWKRETSPTRPGLIETMLQTIKDGKPSIITPSLLQDVHRPAVETAASLTLTSEDAKLLKLAAQFNYI